MIEKLILTFFFEFQGNIMLKSHSDRCCFLLKDFPYLKIYRENELCALEFFSTVLHIIILLAFFLICVNFLMYQFSCQDNIRKVIDMLQYFAYLNKNLPLLRFKCVKKFDYSKYLLNPNYSHLIHFYLNAILVT